MPRVLKKTPGQLHAIDGSSFLKFLILRDISAFPVPCFARWPCFCIVMGWFRFLRRIKEPKQSEPKEVYGEHTETNHRGIRALVLRARRDCRLRKEIHVRCE